MVPVFWINSWATYRTTSKHPQKISTHNARVTYPLLLDSHTLLYLASEPDGSGSSLYAMDVQRRFPHRLSFGVEQYTSLAASEAGHRVAATVSEPQPSLWRVPLSGAVTGEAPQRIALSTGIGFAPRRGPDYLLFVAAAGTGESVWKMAGTATTQLWSGADARVIGAPAVSADRGLVAFSVRQSEKTRLYVTRSDGSGIRAVNDSLQLRGTPAFEPGDKAVSSAVDDHGNVRLMRIPLDAKPPTVLSPEYGMDPTWSSDGKYFIFSGPDIGTHSMLKAATAQGAAHTMPLLELTRGARHLVLPPGGKLLYLQGELHHKNLWSMDLESGVAQKLTNLPNDFDVRDFDISPDGRSLPGGACVAVEIIVELAV